MNKESRFNAVKQLRASEVGAKNRLVRNWCSRTSKEVNEDTYECVIYGGCILRSIKGLAIKGIQFVWITLDKSLHI